MDKISEAKFFQDIDGVVTICTKDKRTIYSAWGYLHARDRMFQMDLLRRKASGKMSEIFGQKTVALDLEQRQVGLEQLAISSYQQLPQEQKLLLDAYTDGVNKWIKTHHYFFTPEYVLLRCKPKEWKSTDTILIQLSMYQHLCLDIEGKVCEYIMRQSLPTEIAEFFLTRHDSFSCETLPPIPISSLSQIMSHSYVTLPVKIPHPRGSNCFVLQSFKSESGTPILANDMHLPLGVPNIWHRVTLKYDSHQISGIAIPGIPLIIAGSNRILSWGHANIPADATHIIPITENHRLNIQKRKEYIKIRSGIFGYKEIEKTYLYTESGPVYRDLVNNKNFLVQWSAYWPNAINFEFWNLYEAKNIDQAINIIRKSGTPPLQILLAHKDGQIVKMINGKIPEKSGEHLIYGKFRDNNTISIQRNPSIGFFVVANNQFNNVSNDNDIGYNYPLSYRYQRLYDTLISKEKWSTNELLELQRDTNGEFYHYYKKLFESSITFIDRHKKSSHRLMQISDVLNNWDGQCNAHSKGIAFLVIYREMLLQIIFSSYLSLCQKYSHSFKYTWRKSEVIARQILDMQPTEILPPFPNCDSWGELLKQVAINVAVILEKKTRKPLDKILWEDLFKIEMKHILGNSWITNFFNLRNLPSDGASECISSFGNGSGVSQRLVVSPGLESAGLFEMPGGQSGNFFSPMYRNHHIAWISKKPLLFFSKDYVKVQTIKFIQR